MKTGKVFWGSFFLTLGSLILLSRFELLMMNWDYVWDLWPLVFIFWGLIIMVSNKSVKPIIVLLFGVFFATQIYGTINSLVSTQRWEKSYSHESSDYYSEDFDSTIQHASLELRAGAGIFSISGGTDRLVDVDQKGNLARYDFYTRTYDDIAGIQIEQENYKYNVLDGKKGNELDILLNDQPTWDFILKVGAAKNYLDFENLDVRSIDLKCGASSLWIKLGDKSDKIDVDLEIGVTGVEILIPENADCEIRGDMVLIVKDLDGFVKESDHYRSKSNHYSDQKILINVNGAVSSFEVNRY
ncbi:MAG: DUF5668 domain-containing protein [Melioribacteraceae bacterium]|nr:DUF5668 domain-containing protein [Melioribacteraceae bacterium]MCF8265762.1 DUF5668 domain-containing protein [Melioribacteraceae bacterium]MCF8412077.1 DUF5668 domain-containing protein [Melioribacteraceae bacterium]MCF8432107.1 DUF5668 domain-containing protein [Melioribacteraceae bacterium]